MQRMFESCGYSYDVEYFHKEDADMVRFYERKNQSYNVPLSDLVMVEPSYGILLIQYIGDDCVVSGTLNNKYFCKEMIGDILSFLEDNLLKCKNNYQPYHIDFVSVSGYEEYNGEY